MTPKLNEALVKFQSEITAPKKTKKAKIPTKNGNTYEYMYADLSAIIDHIRAKLLEHGLAILQGGKELPSGKIVFATTVIHVSGEERDFIAPMFQNPGDDPKADGSWFTYYRRYGLCAALGIAAEEDDDGSAAKGRETKPPKDRPPQSGQPAAARGPATNAGPKPTGPKPAAGAAPTTPPKTSPDQIKRMFAIAKKNKWTEVQLRDVLHKSSQGSVTSFSDLEKGQYDWLCAAIDGRSYSEVVKEFGG